MKFAAWAWLLSFVFKIVRRKIFDHDIWWHLACGRHMVENHVFLRSETFSHTMFGTPWINFEWLSQILLYVIVKHFGLHAILYGKVAMIFVILAVLGYVLYRMGMRGPVLYVMTFAGFFIMQPRLYERVELITLLLITLFVFLLGNTRSFSSTFRKKLPWVLSALMVLWCNLHGGFVYGIGITVLFLLGAYWAKEPKEVCRTLEKSLVLMLVALFINPFGVNLTDVFVEHLVQLFGGPSVIQEWAPLSAEANPAFWVMLFCCASVIYIGFSHGQKRVRFWTPVVLVFILWGARHQRNAALAALVALPFLADSFSGPGPWRNWIQDTRQLRIMRWVGWLVAVTVACTTIPRMKMTIPTGLLQENRFPSGACKFVRDNNVQGVMYNTYEMGGYIEWELAPAKPPAGEPERKVFMDGRYLFHPLLVDHHRLDHEVMSNPKSKGWAEYLAQYKVDYAIVGYSEFSFPSNGTAPFELVSANVMFPRSDWALVYWDDAGMVFLKRTKTFEALIKKFEYKALWPYNIQQMNILLGSRLVLRADVEGELERHKQEVNFSVLRSQLEELVKDADLKKL